MRRRCPFCDTPEVLGVRQCPHPGKPLSAEEAHALTVKQTAPESIRAPFHDRSQPLLSDETEEDFQ